MTPLLARLSAALDNPAFAALAWLVALANIAALAWAFLLLLAGAL